MLMQSLALVFFFVFHFAAAKIDPFLTYPTNIETIKKHLKTERPTIAVLSLYVAGPKILKKVPKAKNCSYIAASFVRFIESAGGRAVPLQENLKDHEVKKILKSVNGAIVPGGDIEMVDNGYDRISEKIYKFSIAQKKRGIIWPVLAINRGAQRMVKLTINQDITDPVDCMNLSMPLMFTSSAKKSRLFKNAADGIWKTFAERPMTFNAHARGISFQGFSNSTKLTKFYRIISTNKDRNGTEFVSTFEAKHYPIYGMQWHPEKISFVWNPVLALDHSPDAIRAAQYVANFFMVEARKNGQRFMSREEEEAHLMFRHKTTYIGNIVESPYEQIYLFKNANASSFGEHLPESFKDVYKKHL